MGRILVGVHRTAAASQALKWAAGTAARQEALLHVVTVITPGWAVSGYESYLATLPDALLDASRRQAAFIENVVGVQPDLRVRREIVVGTAVDRLVALSEGADLLVVGKRSRWWPGIDWPHTARGCVKASRCPVVVVHERDVALLREPVTTVPFSVLDRGSEWSGGPRPLKVCQLPDRRCRRHPQVHTEATPPRLSE
jgi:nucleotide-binding universal stress UspA family protein